MCGEVRAGVDDRWTWVHTASVKAALEFLGQPAGPMRLPLAPLDDAVREAVAEVLAGLGLTRG